MAAFSLAVLAACDRQVSSPELLESYRFFHPIRAETLSIQLTPPPASALLVRVVGHEAALESSFFNHDRGELRAVRLPYLRAGPVLQVFESGPDGGSIDVRVIPAQVTRNAYITVSIYRLPHTTELDRARIRAFGNYSEAIQSTDDESVDTWTGRLQQMQRAAAVFKRTGDEEYRLWSEYLAAYFSYFPLADYEGAIAQARKVQKLARKSKLHLIELMAMQLEGQALIERDAGDSPAAAVAKFRRAQEVLQRTADQALALELPFEQAWAINTRGIAYFYQDRHERAGQQYQRALEFAIELEDDYLENLVRGNLALVDEKLGKPDAALAELQEINRQLQGSGAVSELAHNWSELGRLYQSLFLFPQAIDALTRALELSREIQSVESTGRIGLLLASAYQGMGYMDRSRSIIEAAIANMETANYARGLNDGLRLLADMHRFQGNFAEMAVARERQGNYLTSIASRAQFNYDLGLDALARNPDVPANAGPYFERTEQLATEAQNEAMRIRARLQHCIIGVAAAPASQQCELSMLAEMVQAWLPGAVPRKEFEIRFLLADLQIKAGSEEQASASLESLIDDVQTYRNTLPGVLGAWYWESRAKVFRTYLDLELRNTEAPRHSTRSLLALNRILNTGRRSTHTNTTVTEKSGYQAARMRALLASLEATGDEQLRMDIRQAIEQQLVAASGQIDSTYSTLDEARFTRALDSMPPNSAVLAYYFSAQGFWVWIAKASGVELMRLGDSAEWAELLGRARQGIRVMGNSRRDRDLEALGNLLIAPLKDKLPETVYLLASGELAGFPFEAIRLNDRYFGEGHNVVNLLSLEGLVRREATGGDARAWSRILLAGSQGSGDSRQGGLPGASVEIDGIAKLFGGREIKRVTGHDLKLDSVSGDEISSADLVHIASHGRINLEYPELSRLMVSGVSSSGTGQYLTPLDIGGLPLSAELVVLSACETTGLNAFAFDSHLGFVSEFLHTGAGAVVASLWPVGDAVTQEFMLTFYSAMLTGLAAPEALASSKRRFIGRESAGEALNWPAFQIYLN